MLLAVQLRAEMINFPNFIEVQAGDDYELICQSDEGVKGRIVKDEDLDEDELLTESFRYAKGRTGAFLISEKIENANTKEHDGLYTCIVFHGSIDGALIVPTYSTAECLVIVADSLNPTYTSREPVNPPTPTATESFEPITATAAKLILLSSTPSLQDPVEPSTPSPTDPVNPPTPTPTQAEGPDEVTMGASHVCSVFPGGVIESFDGIGNTYDLACTHVLAAHMVTGDDDFVRYPWFIYGTFDEHEGNKALMSMTFFVGRSAFEFQRGWLVSLEGGKKFPVKEGQNPVQIPNTPCYVMFQDKHLQLRCGYFEAYYDGIMSGHVRLISLRSNEQFEKRNGNIGLCWDAQSGWRKNWQVGRTYGECAVSLADKTCKTEKASCVQYARDAPFSAQGLGAWALCEAGPTQSCSEINCGDKTASVMQECALQQASRIMCSLKHSTPLSGTDDKCPADECVWKKDVLSRGCPQDNPPFRCA